MSSIDQSVSPDSSSKPGRKPIQTEPKNKRTAQNRAAQRAFRERKEKKMQELEIKVQLLENEKLQITNETELLRIQVDALMSELTKVKGGSTITLPTSLPEKLSNNNDDRNRSSTNLTYSSESGSASSTPNANSLQTPTSTCSSNESNFRKPSSDLISTEPVSGEYQFPWGATSEAGNLMAQIKLEPDVWRNDDTISSSKSSLKLTSTDGQTPSSSLDTPLSSSISNTMLNQENFKGDYNEEVSDFCADLGTVCGDKTCPIPKAHQSHKSSTDYSQSSVTNGGFSQDFMVPSTASDSPLLQNKDSPFQALIDNTSVSAQTPNNRGFAARKQSINDVSFLFDVPAYDASLVFSGANPDAFTSPDFFVDGNDDFGEFMNNSNNNNNNTNIDPLSHLVTEESKDDPLSDFFRSPAPQLTADNLNMLNHNADSSSPQQQQLQQQQALAQSNADDTDGMEQVPNTSDNMMKCSQIWERITTHPRFSELDIDGLCHEMKQKAKCSEKGVVVDGGDVSVLLHKATDSKKAEKDTSAINQFLKGFV